jgi:hypothetical protein
MVDPTPVTAPAAAVAAPERPVLAAHGKDQASWCLSCGHTWGDHDTATGICLAEPTAASAGWLDVCGCEEHPPTRSAGPLAGPTRTAP